MAVTDTSRVKTDDAKYVLHSWSVQSAIDPIAPRGEIAEWTGAHGIFKSTIALAACLSVSSGRRFGGLPVVPGRAVFITAEDGERGCEMAAAEHPDIILMDLEMPGVDGWEATRRLKSNADTRDIPIIALSAHALAGSREKALAAGCDEFDTKPIEFDRLVGTVRRVLAARKPA